MTKILLAYSGGLDSAVILHWLASRGHEVVAYTAQLGGHEPEFKYQAKSNGAIDSVIEDLQDQWVNDVATTARSLDASYGKYLLHVALGKIVIAKNMTQYAKREGIRILAHGAHKGENDYYRLTNFIGHMSNVLSFDFTPYAPWEHVEFKKQFADRQALLAYAHANSMKVSSVGETTLTSEPTILGVNYENGALVDTEKGAEEIHEWHIPHYEQSQNITLYFNKGSLEKLTVGKKIYSGTRSVLEELTALGTKMGIGIVDVIEPNIDGSRARCVYIQPATYIWHEAHMELGNMVLTNEEIRRRNYISHRSGELIYRGHWFDDEMERLKAEVRSHNTKYTGWVKFQLHPGVARITARSVGS